MISKHQRSGPHPLPLFPDLAPCRWTHINPGVSGGIEKQTVFLLLKNLDHFPNAGQITIFHQPRFPWNKGISITKPPFGVRSCEVAIIWPAQCQSILLLKNMLIKFASFPPFSGWKFKKKRNHHPESQRPEGENAHNFGKGKTSTSRPILGFQGSFRGSIYPLWKRRVKIRILLILRDENWRRNIMKPPDSTRL